MRRSLRIVPPLPPATLLARRRAPLPFPLEEPTLRLLSSGRQALYLGLRGLGISRGDEVLAPAYHHGSEIEAIERAGARCRFYAGNPRLEPDEAELEGLLRPSVRALHLTHFVGFPQAAGRWREWCSRHDLFLVEDAAQAWLSLDGGRPVGSVGDLAVYCLYKAAPVPDGAALVGVPTAAAAEPAPAGARGTARQLGRWAVQRSRLLAALAPAPGAAVPFDPEAEFGLGEPLRVPLRATRRLLPRLAYGQIRERRRRNYALLLEALGARAPEPFDVLPGGASPFFFPVRTADKRGLLEHLGAAGIHALDFWAAGHPSLSPAAFPEVTERRETTVGLPVHHVLSGDDVAHIAEAAASWPE